MVWVEPRGGRPFVVPPPFSVFVTLWAWMRIVPRATVSSRDCHCQPTAQAVQLLSSLGMPSSGHLPHLCSSWTDLFSPHQKETCYFLFL